MGFAFRLFCWLLIPLALIGLPAMAIVMGIESEPLVAQKARFSIADVNRAQSLLQRYDPRRMKPGEITTVLAREDELNAALNVALAGMGRVNSRIAVDGAGVTLAATAELPVAIGPLGRYVNMQAAIAPSRQGLEVSRLRIGGLEMPSGIALPVMQAVFETLLGAGRGQEIVDSIRSVDISGKTVAVAYRPPQRIFEDLKNAARKMVRIGDPETIRIYYNKLVEQAWRQGSTVGTSLTAFMIPVFRLAAERSMMGNPVAENRAAILALSMFLGDERMERFIGRVVPARGRRPQVSHVRLDGRHDFVQHFVTSAGLAVAGGSGIADLIGVAKEFKDSGVESGFSFSDLAADRAGIRFAEEAVGSRDAAMSFQQSVAAGIAESDIFPLVLDLPEGLSRAEFDLKFGDTNSTAYRSMVAEIDRRIENIPLYR